MPSQRKMIQPTADGMTQAKIAAEMGLSPYQVYNALRYLVKTQGFENRVHMIAEALRRGWIK